MSMYPILVGGSDVNQEIRNLRWGTSASQYTISIDDALRVFESEWKKREAKLRADMQKEMEAKIADMNRKKTDSSTLSTPRSSVIDAVGAAAGAGLVGLTGAALAAAAASSVPSPEGSSVNMNASSNSSTSPKAPDSTLDSNGVTDDGDEQMPELSEEPPYSELDAVSAEAGAEAGADAEADADADAESVAEADAEPDAESGAKAEAEAESDAESGADAKPGAEDDMIQLNSGSGDWSSAYANKIPPMTLTSPPVEYMGGPTFDPDLDNKQSMAQIPLDATFTGAPDTSVASLPIDFTDTTTRNLYSLEAFSNATGAIGVTGGGKKKRRRATTDELASYCRNMESASAEMLG